MARFVTLFVVSPLLVFAGFYAAGSYGMLMGYPFWILACCFWAFPLAGALARPWGGLIMPTDRYSRPQPMYSIPESLRRKNKIQESFDAYQAIAREYRGEVKPWGEMIRLAHLELKNNELRDAVYQEGLRKLRGKERKAELNAIYEALVTMSQTTPTAADRPTVAYHRQGESAN